MTGTYSSSSQGYRPPSGQFNPAQAAIDKMNKQAAIDAQVRALKIQREQMPFSKQGQITQCIMDISKTRPY